MFYSRSNAIILSSFHSTQTPCGWVEASSTSSKLRVASSRYKSKPSVRTKAHLHTIEWKRISALKQNKTWDVFHDERLEPDGRLVGRVVQRSSWVYMRLIESRVAQRTSSLKNTKFVKVKILFGNLIKYVSYVTISRNFDLRWLFRNKYLRCWTYPQIQWL